MAPLGSPCIPYEQSSGKHRSSRGSVALTVRQDRGLTIPRSTNNSAESCGTPDTVIVGGSIDPVNDESPDSYEHPVADGGDGGICTCAFQWKLSFMSFGFTEATTAFLVRSMPISGPSFPACENTSLRTHPQRSLPRILSLRFEAEISYEQGNDGKEVRMFRGCSAHYSEAGMSQINPSSERSAGNLDDTFWPECFTWRMVLYMNELAMPFCAKVPCKFRYWRPETQISSRFLAESHSSMQRTGELELSCGLQIIQANSASTGYSNGLVWMRMSSYRSPAAPFQERRQEALSVVARSEQSSCLSISQTGTANACQFLSLARVNGVTGLLIAQGLRKASIPYILFERDGPAEGHEWIEQQTREWSMSLHWAFPHMAALLPDDLLCRFKDVLCNPFRDPPDEDELPLFNAESGELLTVLPLQRVYRVSREKLRALLREGVNAQYNKRLMDVNLSDDGSQVTARFQDGTDAIGCSLVGADGARSTIRRILFGSDDSLPTDIPFEGFSVIASYPEKIATMLCDVHPMYMIGVHPDGYFFWLSVQDVPNPEDQRSWQFVISVTRKMPVQGKDYDQPSRLAIVKEIAAQCSEPFRSAFMSLPDSHPVWHVKLSYWAPLPWDNRSGRITLAGDAAHPMTYHRGQGLNHAVNDSWTFVERMKEIVQRQKTLAESISEYDAECRERGGKEVLASLRNTEVVHSWTRLKESDLFNRAFAKGMQHEESK
ncbi:FAD/NAD(P)-binding domain-containing protein [Heliocybe sulcata]|uniref:FAD/NAD(P)-binding domain-containing protein n=1 Tax=Heliocybe sulcata TaxID=5364 RepID=A0A5C3MMN8_9AGAM|nr:FAD/NAD(P)-binding domain-containing protein [Heliocybe sulcata]